MKKQINNNKSDKYEFENQLDDYSKEFVKKTEYSYRKNNNSHLIKENKALLIERMDQKVSIPQRIFRMKIPAYYAAAAVLFFCIYLVYNSNNVIYRDSIIVKKDTVLVEKEVIKTITKEVKVNKNINNNLPIVSAKTIYDDSVDLSYLSTNPISRNISNSLMNNLESVQNEKKGFTANDDSINKIIGNIRYY